MAQRQQVRIHLKNGQVISFTCTRFELEYSNDGYVRKWSYEGGTGWTPRWIHPREIVAVEMN